MEHTFSFLSKRSVYSTSSKSEYILFAARNRGIAIPADLESQIQALFTRSQLVMKHTRHWLSHGKVRRDSMMNLSRDYRSIIEGLQVRSSTCRSYLHNFLMSTTHRTALISVIPMNCARGNNCLTFQEGTAQ